MTDTVDDFLAHHGVKGMKWGVTRSDAQLARASGRKEARAEKKAAKAQRNKEITDARARQEKRTGDLNKKAAATYFQTTKKGQEAAQKAYEKAEYKLLYGKDAKTASLLTSGERVATGLALGVTVALIAATSAASLVETRR